MEILDLFPDLTVGEVLVTKNSKNQLKLFIPSLAMIHAGWEFKGVDKNNKLVYSKQSKMNK
jgi:hypothetical protein